MIRRRIIRWLSGAIFAVLVVLTAVSNRVYEGSLPEVHTWIVEQELGELIDGYDGPWETSSWVPVECVFPGSREDVICVYRIRQRTGQFDKVEYYVEAVEAPVLDTKENAVLVDNLYLNFRETLVCQTDLPLLDGQTVVWLNSEQ